MIIVIMIMTMVIMITIYNNNNDDDNDDNNNDNDNDDNDDDDGNDNNGKDTDNDNCSGENRQKIDITTLFFFSDRLRNPTFSTSFLSDFVRGVTNSPENDPITPRYVILPSIGWLFCGRSTRIQQTKKTYGCGRYPRLARSTGPRAGCS